MYDVILFVFTICSYNKTQVLYHYSYIFASYPMTSFMCVLLYVWRYSDMIGVNTSDVIIISLCIDNS